MVQSQTQIQVRLVRLPLSPKKVDGGRKTNPSESNLNAGAKALPLAARQKKLEGALLEGHPGHNLDRLQDCVKFD